MGFQATPVPVQAQVQIQVQVVVPQAVELDHIGPAASRFCPHRTSRGSINGLLDGYVSSPMGLGSSRPDRKDMIVVKRQLNEEREARRKAERELQQSKAEGESAARKAYHAAEDAEIARDISLEQQQYLEEKLDRERTARQSCERELQAAKSSLEQLRESAQHIGLLSRDRSASLLALEQSSMAMLQAFSEDAPQMSSEFALLQNEVLQIRASVDNAKRAAATSMKLSKEKLLKQRAFFLMKFTSLQKQLGKMNTKYSAMEEQARSASEGGTKDAPYGKRERKS